MRPTNFGRFLSYNQPDPMRFVFSRRFYVLIALGLVPLSLSWTLSELRYAVFFYDAIVIAVAIVDVLVSRKLPAGLSISRSFDKRFAIGDPNEVILDIENATDRAFHVKIKDEYPAEMKLDERREAEFTVGTQTTAEFTYVVTPPMRGRYDFG